MDVQPPRAHALRRPRPRPVSLSSGVPMAVLRMTNLDLSGKRVLIREDLNVPLKDGKVAAIQRLEAALPTLKLARDAGARVMVMSHLGRPKEGVFEESESL